MLTKRSNSSNQTPLALLGLEDVTPVPSGSVSATSTPEVIDPGPEHTPVCLTTIFAYSSF